MTCPIVFRGPNGAAARVAAQHSQCYASWYAHCPGPARAGAVERRRRQGPAQGRDPRSQSGDLPRERDPLRPVSSTCRRIPISCCRSARPRSSAPARTSRSPPSRSWSARRCRRPRSSPSRASRPRSSTCAACVRSTPRPSSIRSRRPTGWSRSRRAGRSPASARSSPRQMMEHAFDWLDAPVKRVHGHRRAAALCRQSREAGAAAAGEHRRGRPRGLQSLTRGAGHADQYPDARAVAHHDRGQARQVAREGGRRGQVRPGDLRDRDRQGDDGGRGGRRRQDRQDRRARGRRGREGQCRRSRSCWRRARPPCRPAPPPHRDRAESRSNAGSGSAKPAPAAAAPAARPLQPGTCAPAPAATPAAAPSGGRIFASPLAKRIAAEKGLDLSRSRQRAATAASSRPTSRPPSRGAAAGRRSRRRRRAQGGTAARRTAGVRGAGRHARAAHRDAQGHRAAHARVQADRAAFLPDGRLRDRRAAGRAPGDQRRGREEGHQGLGQRLRDQGLRQGAARSSRSATPRGPRTR